MRLEREYTGEDGVLCGDYAPRVKRAGNAPPGKTEFLEDARRVLKDVARRLAPHGFAVHDRIRVNPGGSAVAGDVTLNLWNASARVGVKLAFLACGVQIEGEARRDQLCLLALKESAPRKNDGCNVWWHAGLASSEISRRVKVLSGVEQPQAQTSAAIPDAPGLFASAPEGQLTLFAANEATGDNPAEYPELAVALRAGLSPVVTLRVRLHGEAGQMQRLLQGLDVSLPPPQDGVRESLLNLDRAAHNALVARARIQNNTRRGAGLAANVHLARLADGAWCNYLNL